jgi:hypothetical protein
VRLRLAILGVLVPALAGCGSRDDNKPSGADIPPPPIEKLLPPHYQVDEVMKANLTDRPVPETVITSVGPPAGDIGLQPATIQVLSWDDSDKRWAVLFDAQKTVAPDTYASTRTSNRGPGALSGIDPDPEPVLDPEAAVSFDLVGSAQILKGDRDQLVFSADSSYGGSGVPATLVVVDFKDARAKVVYAWRGEHLRAATEGNRIRATSSYWTRADAHCCPSRDYRFVVGPSGSSVTELEDERPYLGVLVREHGEGLGDGPLEVLEVADSSPASGKLRAGDVLLDVANVPKPPKGYVYGDKALFNKISAFDAGEEARLVIRRNGAELTVPVELGSLKDAKTMFIPEDEDRVDAL